jgi:hypothetical protein
MIYAGSYPMRADREGGRRRGRGNFFSIDASDNWNYNEWTTVRVVCYTNQPKARLMLNDVQIDDVKELNDTIGMIYWDIPFLKGKLTAQALDNNGNITASYMLKTDKTPVELQIEDLTDEGLKEGKNPQDARLLQLLVKIVDEDGNIVKNANNEIVCDIEGEAMLLGLEASNNSDMSDYTDNRHNAFRGTILAYIRKKSTAPVKMTFSSLNLKQTSITR